MTAKRFTVFGEWHKDDIVDEIRCDGGTLTIGELVELLNELHEENEALKSSNLEYEDALGRFEEEIEQLKKQMQRLYNYFVDWHGDIMGANQFSEMWDDVKEDENWEL